MNPRNFFLTIVFFSLVAITSTFAQSGWNANNWYASQGRSVIETTFQNEYNPYYNSYVSVKYCRQLNWHQEWYSGYVYYWRYNEYYQQYQWVSQYQEGNFWYCTWSAWFRC